VHVGWGESVFDSTGTCVQYVWEGESIGVRVGCCVRMCGRVWDVRVCVVGVWV